MNYITVTNYIIVLRYCIVEILAFLGKLLVVQNIVYYKFSTLGQRTAFTPVGPLVLSIVMSEIVDNDLCLPVS